jgi:hypothetical protein
VPHEIDAFSEPGFLRAGFLTLDASFSIIQRNKTYANQLNSAATEKNRPYSKNILLAQAEK